LDCVLEAARALPSQDSRDDLEKLTSARAKLRTAVRASERFAVAHQVGAIGKHREGEALEKIGAGAARPGAVLPREKVTRTEFVREKGPSAMRPRCGGG